MAKCNPLPHNFNKHDYFTNKCPRQRNVMPSHTWVVSKVKIFASNDYKIFKRRELALE
jgi:hypothetical protein